MKLVPIRTFEEFCADLLKSGFSMGGDNAEGVFSLSSLFQANLRHHTGDPETDPWIWRIRAVTEREEFAGGKFFLGKNGWITREWLPRFISVRRQGRTMEERYAQGLVPRMAKTLYDRIREEPHCHMVQLRSALGIGKEDRSRFDGALCFLQRELFIVVSGEARKTSLSGAPYGWPVTTYCTASRFFGDALEEEAAGLDPSVARIEVIDRIRELNPAATDGAIARFLG